MAQIKGTIDKLYEEAQAKLPPEDRGAKDDERFCGVVYDGFGCTKAIGHAGKHVAHGVLGYVITRWD